MATTNMKSWRRGRSFDVSARSLNNVACPSITADSEQSSLPFALPANKQHDYLGTARVNTSP